MREIRSIPGLGVIFMQWALDQTKAKYPVMLKIAEEILIFDQRADFRMCYVPPVFPII